MTIQGADLLDDLQEFLNHYDYDSDDDLSSFYDSEDSFYDTEDYDSDELGSSLSDTDSDSDSSDSDSDSDSDWLECKLVSILSNRTLEPPLVWEIFWRIFLSQNLQPTRRKISKIVIFVFQ